MKTKLVKEYGDFYLISDDEIKAGDEYVKLNNRPRTLCLGSTISSYVKVPKLSLKNCQAIEKGYDLDELADEYIIVKPKYREHEHNMRADGFKAGFQKALELMKHRLPEETEWDVEVTMMYFTEYDTNPVTIEHKTEPKLDADGCLILKRI